MSEFNQKLTNWVRRTGSHPGLRAVLVSVGLVLSIGLLLSIATTSNASHYNLSRLLTWVWSLLIGYFGHTAVLVFFLLKGWLPKRKTLVGMLPAMAFGMLLTYGELAVLGVHGAHTIFEWLMVGFSVLAISIIVQVFIYPTRCYDSLIDLQRLWLNHRLSVGAKKPDAAYLLVEQTDNDPVQIWLTDLCLVQVNDHYLSYGFLDQGEYKEVVAYGRLKDLSDRLGAAFLQPNRSTLVNQTQVKCLKQQDGTHCLLMNNPQVSITVPQSRLSEIKKAMLEQA